MTDLNGIKIIESGNIDDLPKGTSENENEYDLLIVAFYKKIITS